MIVFLRSRVLQSPCVSGTFPVDTLAHTSVHQERRLQLNSRTISRERLWLAAVGLAAASVLSLGAARPDTNPATSTPVKAKANTIRYGRDIRPILSDRCFQCHGQDPATRRENLRLDNHADAVAARKNGAAIVPGDSSASEVMRRISSTDENVKMPPTDSHKRSITAEERELIKRWIDAGAEYESHWSLQVPVRPKVPDIKDATNPIDSFIFEALAEKGITPSPAAGQRELFRRLFMDVTGLPPTPEEVDSFLTDQRDDAFERWVDKLMTTEPYKSRMAERLAAPWLDQARYADTCGIHMDAGRQIWPYRDWVLNAFRTNMPFDQFVIEQLAGDLLPNATQSQKVASGFNRNHTTTDEGGAIAEEYLVEYAVDRVSTTGSVFLGMAVGCARCHDHKYDPISSREFYSMYAYFNSIEEPGLYDQRTDANRAFEPLMMLPSPEQEAELAGMKDRKEKLAEALTASTPEDEVQRKAFFSAIESAASLAWESPRVTTAESTMGATLTVQPDGSVLASGENPERDEHIITLRTDKVGLSAVALEAMGHESFNNGRPGRAPNGNAVLTGIRVEATSVADPAKKETVNFVWAWANNQQLRTDLRTSNVIDLGDGNGWGIGAHEKDGSRVAMLLSDRPFGFEGGTELKVTLEYASVYAHHTLGHVRIWTSPVSAAGLATLPVAASGWWVAAPFGLREADNYEKVHGPETGPLDLKQTFGESKTGWKIENQTADDKVVNISDVVSATYLAREIFSPTERELQVSLGSDDGFRLYVNGKEIAGKNIGRGVMPDQDRAVLPLKAGRNTIVYKIVNTGGPSGYYWKFLPPSTELSSLGVLSLVPQPARTDAQMDEARKQWLELNSPRYRKTIEEMAQIDKDKAALDSRIPRTMIMKELAKQRDTFVLTRGQYDHPDKTQPVSRGIPAALGTLPPDAPADRRGLANWIMSKENALTARVTVNRMWEQLFGMGIVKTGEDFGVQGEWPSHPELLDWLAVEFRESGWNTQHMLKLMLTSRTYRQSSKVRPELKETDPDNRLLASFPRRRLTAEQLRDQALYISGLLVEKLGGPSVKPYQPDGLWNEVAMPQSNTREYQRGTGEDLYRRSLYTYWKRAAPPPSMLTLDAPTREFCTVRRPSTSTPLQALVLWNDEQFVEAARVLAQRTMAESGDDAAKLSRVFERCTAKKPDAQQLAALTSALADFRTRFKESPEDAAKSLKYGMAPVPDVDKSELAAWTLIANAVMNLYEATTQE